MLTIATWAAIVMVGGAIALTLWRLWKGPGIADRILALDTLTINAIALVLLADVALDTSVYFEAALLMAMMGFVGTVALAVFVRRGTIIE
ncbi:multicomponent K+:H+ antiporter subunit F [Polymorphobacter multimanifer]|uniref:Multicomponent K+:H+ antiporter subunit F n=1 Tax=Polymorphobacter multimanifer TaxID=1070431 RepID=A0A841L6I9_9SPHN|nr:K+/H+ antiporter subunit F [Polymorphobacter multimanifer]MBB6226573.1 multicomponent K+:H+ antiporter subunit F [Polymorphobacter multimanifer]